MKKSILFSVLAGIIYLGFTILASAAQPPAPPLFKWTTVVNNNDAIPEVPDRTFNSYNPPSVSANGLVVFRARSRGGQGLGPATHGIYTRNMGISNQPVTRVLDRSVEVPYPNNLETTFVETPAFPRIDRWWGTVVTRGNHQPVWEYTPEGKSDTTRAGTSGIYATPYGELLTAASKLGTAPGFDFFAVPDVETLIPFDVFPGAPAVTDGFTIVFKGNYTVNGSAKTGVYYRDLDEEPAGGISPVVRIADTTDTDIPGSDPPVLFGSTAPPSAEDGLAVFAGFDNEEQPTAGGIYLVPLTPQPLLTEVVAIGARVPSQPVQETFSKLGEGLAFDGRYVGFWAAWGDETRTVRLYCPEEGNKDRRDYCNHTGEFAEGGGDPNSICEEGEERCYQEKEVPVNQGVFVHDTEKKQTQTVAKTGTDFDDFLFWNYSGKVPGVGTGHGDEVDEGDGEPVRWRSSAFAAVSKGPGQTYRAVFKGVRDGETGLYLNIGPGQATLTILDTTTPGQQIDPEAPAGSEVTDLGLEREGLRNQWLTVTVRMEVEGGSEEEGMAGIYLTEVPANNP